MKIKSIVTAIAMAGTFGSIAVTASEQGGTKNEWSHTLKPVNAKVKTIKNVFGQSNLNVSKKKVQQREYFKDNPHEGKKRYIVRLADDPVSSYKGNVKGLAATNKSALKSGLNNQKIDTGSVEVSKYVSYLDKKQSTFISQASSKLGFKVPELKRFKYAVNGFVTELTYSEAQAVSKMAGVEFVEQDQIFQLDTDTGPLLIGAGEVWDGTAGSSEFRGEGVVIGILDTGVNTDHPSFAATGDDGYTVVNPLGAGTYLGDCATDASLCNSKLIGVYSYPEITAVYSDAIFAGNTRPENGEDYDGHGSHTASTAGGNVLVDVPYMVNDFTAGDTDDGIATSYTFSQMSGVAPHANIISYQVCLPGSNGDTFSGCVGTAIVSAIDDAIADGVDVINYSIGGSVPFSPWTSSIELGFLNAQAAGVFVATSAGNSGPAPSTTTKVSPWYTSVAASNHGNAGIEGSGKSIGSFSGGDTTAPSDISGGGINGNFTGEIVYAGDFTNSNDPDGDPAQCLEPFPGGTFTSTQIVVCDRGDIARVEKAANAAAGGAGGFVLANIQGGADSIADDYYAVPGIHISADDGDALKTWLASGTGHQATITAATLSRATNTADQIASFSSRGPNAFGEIITPQIAAPGVAIYAAYSDDQPFKDVTGGAPVDYAFLQGTSMASPHVAGAAALMSQAHPSWNPDQIRSALMMTATSAMLKENGETAATPWDMGSGRVQVNEAINAGLVMSETQANYLAADPDMGGDPKTLNVPSMANFSCAATCSWTRTFTAITAGTYSVSTSSAALTAEPASFDAVAGENYNVVFTMDVSSVDTGTGVFEEVSITSSVSPDLHLPVFALVNNGAVPDSVTINAGRNDGSWVVDGVQTVPTDDLRFEIDGLFDANATGFTAIETFNIAEDPTNASYNDDLDQVYFLEFEVAPNSVALNVEITETTSPDLDLFIEMDTTGDGNYDSLVAFSATGETLESVSIESPPAGSYRAIVQNWAGSGAATDSGTLSVVVVPQTDPVEGLTVDAPSSADGHVDVKLLWDLEMVPGDAYNADISVFAGETFIGMFPITLTRVEDDVSATTDATLINRGESIQYTMTVTPNIYNQDVGYSISVDMPEHMSLDGASVTASGGDITVKDPNAVGLDLSFDIAIGQDPTIGSGEYRDDLDDVDVFEFAIPSGQVSMTVAISGATSPDFDLYVEMDTDGAGNWVNLAGFSGATAETNEIITLSAPVEGNYRAIVQNYDDSSDGAIDTGTLSVTTVPATGEGFIWNFDVDAFLPEYTVDNSATSAECYAAGLGGWAGTNGYTPLSAFGIGTLGLNGDEDSFGLFTGEGINFSFFGQDYDDIFVNANGFLMFSGTAGTQAWRNLPIPNAAEPNNMLAAMWKDQILVDDGTRGLRRAFLGPIAIIDFDGLQPWNSAGDSTDRYYYQAQVMMDGVNDDHSGLGKYELIVSYADTQIGTLSGATAGVENVDGTHGFDVSSMIENGGQLCFNYNAPPVSFDVTFTVTPQAMYSGQEARPMITIDTDMAGTSTMMIEAEGVELVNVAPIANAGDDATYDRSEIDEIPLNAVNTEDYDTDRLSYLWSQVSGDSIALRGGNSRQAFIDVDKVENGSYTFELAVSDGEFSSTDQVTITITGDKEEDVGVGSMGLLLLLGLPLLFRRRYRH